MRSGRYLAIAALVVVPMAPRAARAQEPAAAGHEHHVVSSSPHAERPPAASHRPPPERPPRVLEVGPGRAITNIQAALALSVDGDTIRVHEGVYEEHFTIQKAVTLIGLGNPVVDGGGRGTVITVDAPAEIRGLTIRGSGADQSREDSGIMVRSAEGVRIVDNRITDVLFGIYIKQSRTPVVRGNIIEGKDLPIPRRGDGVRLWYCAGGVVEGNRLWRTRDLVIWFTEGLEIRSNRVTDGRYGLHYMYSDHNLIVGNVFAHNDVGAFLMYSKDIELRENRFEQAAGSSGIGLGLKDSDNIIVEDNTIIDNAIGVFLDNSPGAVGARNEFRGNLLAANDAGVVLLPSVHSNDFTGNAWIDNETPVVVSGGGDGLKNVWTGNQWSDYIGFDEDEDGTGDTPYRHARVADDLFARYPDLRFLTGSPAVSALEILARLFPLLAPRPVVVDSSPRVIEPAFSAAGLSSMSGLDVPVPAENRTAVALLWAASLSAVVAMAALTRRRRT